MSEVVVNRDVQIFPSLPAFFNPNDTIDLPIRVELPDDEDSYTVT